MVLRCETSQKPFTTPCRLSVGTWLSELYLISQAARKAWKRGQSRSLGLRGLRHLPQIPSGGFQNFRLSSPGTSAVAGGSNTPHRSSIRVLDTTSDLRKETVTADKVSNADNTKITDGLLVRSSSRPVPQKRSKQHEGRRQASRPCMNPDHGELVGGKTWSQTGHVCCLWFDPVLTLVYAHDSCPTHAETHAD